MVSSGSESAPWEGTRRGWRAGWVSLAGLRGGPTPILGRRLARGRSSAGRPFGAASRPLLPRCVAYGRITGVAMPPRRYWSNSTVAE